MVRFGRYRSLDFVGKRSDGGHFSFEVQILGIRNGGGSGIGIGEGTCCVTLYL